MIERYKDKIKSLMEWDEENFDKFFEIYFEEYSKYRANKKSSIYTEQYLETVLDLFFYVYINKINNPKSFLMALIFNGLFSDSFNLNPHHIQDIYLLDILDNCLSSILCFDTLDGIKSLLIIENILQIKEISPEYFDLLFMNDFRIMFKATVLPNSQGTLFYLIDPSVCKYSSSFYPFEDSYEPLLNKMNDNYEKIVNPLAKAFFKEKIETFENHFKKQTK